MANSLLDPHSPRDKHHNPAIWQSPLAQYVAPHVLAQLANSLRTRRPVFHPPPHILAHAIANLA